VTERHAMTSGHPRGRGKISTKHVLVLGFASMAWLPKSLAKPCAASYILPDWLAKQKELI